MTVFALDLTILCDRSTWQISWYSWSVCSLLVLWYLEVIYKFFVSTDNFPSLISIINGQGSIFCHSFLFPFLFTQYCGIRT